MHSSIRALAVCSALVMASAPSFATGYSSVKITPTLEVIDLTPGDGNAAGYRFRDADGELSSSFGGVQHVNGLWPTEIIDSVTGRALAGTAGEIGSLYASASTARGFTFEGSNAAMFWEFAVLPHSNVALTLTYDWEASRDGGYPASMRASSSTSIFEESWGQAFEIRSAVDPFGPDASKHESYTFFFSNPTDTVLEQRLTMRTDVQVQVSVVPEPGTYGLLGAGLLTLGFASLYQRRRARSSTRRS